MLRGTFHAALALVAALAISFDALAAQEPPQSAELTADERGQQLEALQRQMAEAQRLRREGKLNDAVRAARQAIEIERRLFPESNPALAETLLWLARAHLAQGDFAEAKASCRRAIEAAGPLVEADRWRAADARCLLEHVVRLEGLDAAQRSQLDDAGQWIAEARELYDQGKAEEAIERVRRAVDLQRRLLGERAPACAAAWDKLAALCQAVYDYPAAEEAYRRALEIRRETLGSGHPDYLMSLNNLGLLYHLLGDDARAEPLLREALEVARRIFGPKHPDAITCLNNLAELYRAGADYSRAEPLLHEALEACEEVRGRDHPDYAIALNNLAGLYQSTGDYARAEPLLREALAIRRAAYGEDHPEYAAGLNNLAGLYYQRGDFDRAEPLFRQTLDLRKRVLGPAHPDYATSLNNLAAVYEALDKPGDAEPLYREALEVRKQALGTGHPDYAAGLNNLAALYRSMEQYARAEPLYREALEIRKAALGTEHPDYAAGLNNLAVLYRSKGDYARAEPLYRQALEIQRRVLQATFSVLSERQQLAMTRALRRTLDGYLSVTSQTGGDPEQAYQSVLAWKGMVFVRQRRTRLAGTRTELAPLLAELQDAAGRLAALVFSQPGPSQHAAWQRRVAELSERKERLEAELARRGAPFASRDEGTTSDQLRAAIPERAALVDFLQYTRSLPSAGGQGEDASAAQSSEPHLAAFVVRPDRPVARFDLGPIAPVDDAVDAWRRTYGQAAKGADAARTLRRLLWEPLNAQLADAETVLVSPDGNLARFPLAALPGEEPGTFLLEERALAVVPVPHWLPEILADPAAEDSPKDPNAPVEASLLVLGDVDYDAVPRKPNGAATRGERGASGEAADRAGRRRQAMHFEPLASSRGEILAVRDSFELAHPDGPVRQLRRHQATEEAFRREVPHRRFVHVATHGFFAPAEWSSLLDPSDEAGRSPTPRGAAPWEGSGLAALHPGLLSGLALAGANALAPAGADDGILTAEEVASLDLGEVDLAVLSACETGLGAVAGGEGVLGLQRAFQVSGARTVVASLWKVSDEATRQLMERFYENLWDRRMGKLEALREAQLAMMREGGHRGMAIVRKQGADEAPPRTPPYYWAAFVLSGDWR